MKHLTLTLSGLLLSALLFAQSGISEFESNWAAWRGPNSTGAAPSGNPPIEWSENNNVKWKVDIPGSGHSTPVVWGDQIFISAAIPIGVATGENATETTGSGFMSSAVTDKVHEFALLAYNRNNGDLLWKTVLHEEVPQDGTHNDGSWASNSPATDGEHIFAYFGSRGLYCLDMQGNVLWDKDFGQMEKRNSFGEGSSPVIYNDKVVVQWDHEGQSAMFVVDKNSGDDVWSKERSEPTSWATPIIVEINGQAQVIAAGLNKLMSYDLANGDVIWETSGLTENIIPSLIIGEDNMIYAMGGYRGYSLKAIDLTNASGDITGTDAVVWTHTRNTSYVPSAALFKGNIYFLRDNRGSLTCLNAKTGEVNYEGAELADVGNLYPSPVAVADRLYFIGGTGVGYTVKAGPEFEILSRNELDDKFEASPVIIGDDIYLKGFEYLYCISAE